MSLSLFGIILGLVLLMFLAYKGYSIIWVAPVCAVVVAVLSGYAILDAYIGDYMKGMADYVLQWFPAFFLGAVYGKVMDLTGSARSLGNALVKLIGPRFAVAAVVIPCLLMTYGGISLFVVVFVIYPMGYSIYRAADLPRRGIPGALCFGCSTFAMIAPGAVQIHNAVPSTNLGTTYMAGAVNGFLACGFMLVVGIIYLHFWLKKAKNNGEHFVAKASDDFGDDANESLPNPIVALLPLVITICLVNIKVGGVVIAPVEVGVLAGAVSAVVLMIKYIDVKQLPKHFADGAAMALISITNTCAVNGFGGVASNSPVFSTITDAMVNIPGPKLLGLVIGTTVIAGICGSASGGLGIAVPILGPVYTQLGIAPSIVHRVMALSSSALDSLPHNGYIVTVTNGLCNETHKDSYGLTFALTVVIPFLGSLVGVLLFTIFPNLP